VSGPVLTEVKTARAPTHPFLISKFFQLLPVNITGCNNNCFLTSSDAVQKCVYLFSCPDKTKIDFIIGGNKTFAPKTCRGITVIAAAPAAVFPMKFLRPIFFFLGLKLIYYFSSFSVLSI
jgi:hypothetical protein